MRDSHLGVFRRRQMRRLEAGASVHETWKQVPAAQINGLKRLKIESNTDDSISEESYVGKNDAPRENVDDVGVGQHEIGGGDAASHLHERR